MVSASSKKTSDQPQLNANCALFSNLQDILSALSEIVQVIDAQTLKVEYSSRSLLELLGYSPQQIAALGDDWQSKVVHPSEYQFLVSHVQNYSKMKKGERSRVVYRAKDGSGGWRKIESIHTVLSLDEDEKVLKIAGLTRELLEVSTPLEEVTAITTEHRCRNCQKLLGVESPAAAVLEIKCHRCGEFNAILRNDLHKLFYSTNSKVYVTDEDGVILYINEAISRISGFKPEEVIGKTPAIWGKQMTTAFYLDMYRQIKQEKRSISHKVTNRKKDGELYEASVQISPILDVHGEVKYFIGIESVHHA